MAMVAAEVAVDTAAEMAAATIDSVVDVGCGDGDDDVVTARTCDGVGMMARMGSGGSGGGGGGGGGVGRWSLAASTARCSSAPLQRSCGSCSICSQMR